MSSLVTENTILIAMLQMAQFLKHSLQDVFCQMLKYR